jgi:hypothetical protein
MFRPNLTLTLSLLAIVAVAGAMPAEAQEHDQTTSMGGASTEQYEDTMPVQRSSPSRAAPDRNGRLGNAGNGRIGQRQSRMDTATNVPPLERVRGRVANRVQNRLRTRIDPFYDPQANATTPFRVASEQAETRRR